MGLWCLYPDDLGCVKDYCGYPPSRLVFIKYAVFCLEVQDRLKIGNVLTNSLSAQTKPNLS